MAVLLAVCQSVVVRCICCHISAARPVTIISAGLLVNYQFKCHSLLFRSQTMEVC